jgi:hypothetical protein
MGALYKRGDIWYINVIAGKKRIRKRVGTSKKLAEMAMKDLEARIIRREYDLDVEDISLYDLFERFLSYSEINHSPRTSLRYKNVTDNFRLFFDLYLKEEIDRISGLRPTHFEDYKRYRRTVDPKTIKVPADYPMPIRAN